MSGADGGRPKKAHRRDDLPLVGLARMGVQVLGFAICIGLLVWIIRDALHDENREQLTRLMGAPWEQVTLLIVLTGVSMWLNGAMFWVAIRPRRSVSMGDIQAVNAIAYLASSLPLKLGLVFRLAVHTRRNRIPMMMVGGWMGAVGLLMLGGLVPPALAGVWRGRMDTWWWLASIGWTALFFIGTLFIARFFATGPGWKRIERFAERNAEGVAGRVLQSDKLLQLHEGVHMLAHPGVVGGCAFLRTADLVVQAWRFVVAAAMIGAVLPWDQAVIGTVIYFLVDSVAPTGAIGIREKLTAGTMGLMAGHDPAVLVLTVSGAEMIVRFVGSGAAALWLRVDRMVEDEDPESLEVREE